MVATAGVWALPLRFRVRDWDAVNADGGFFLCREGCGVIDSRAMGTEDFLDMVTDRALLQKAPRRAGRGFWCCGSGFR